MSPPTDQSDALPVRRPRWPRDLQRRLVDGFHQAGGGVEHVKFGDIPIVVAVAECGGDREARAVGRPGVFVDVGVGRGNLPELSAGGFDQGETLLEESVFDFAGLGSFRHKWSCGARGVLREQHGDRFPIGRPLWTVEEAFYLGEFFGRAGAADIDDVKLQLVFLDRVGKKGEALAVRGPGEATFGVSRIACAGGDVL
jgi:hypothetical protein